MSWSKQKRALLKGRIELTCAEASAFLDAEAAEIKAHDAQNQPVLSVRNMLTRGDSCECRVALRIINNQISTPKEPK
jgi:hypothetical protein